MIIACHIIQKLYNKNTVEFNSLFQKYHMSEVLEKLFHSKAEVKLLRLFLNNPNEGYMVSEAAKRSKINAATARKEINNLAKIKFLTQRKKSGKTYYCADQNFVFYDELKKLIFKASPTSADKLASLAMKLGQIIRKK
jgi:predicted transcriptional regulator